MINIGMPIYESAGIRQEMTASVARNYFEHDYHFLKPTIDFPGPPYQLYLEVPLYQIYRWFCLQNMGAGRHVLGAHD